MASGLDWVALSVPAAVSIFCAVDRRLNLFTSGPIVARVDIDRPILMDEMRADYLRRYQAVDPFAPRRWTASTKRVVGAGDVGGPSILAASPFGSFLTRYGFTAPAVMHLRRDGRIVAALVVLRDETQPELNERALNRLRRCHALLERAYALTDHGRAAAAPPAAIDGSGLTPRERDVARLAASGARNEEIAQTLSMSVPTVKTHMTRVLLKLGVRSRTDIVLALGRHTNG
jgi:DNA-binding CsgD family transcriptional regulator